MSHPLEIFSYRSLVKAFWYLLLATLVLMGFFTWSGAPLRTTIAPGGIIDFELARTIGRAQEIIATWNSQAKLLAAFGLGLDFLFMPVYSSLFAIACLWAGEILKKHQLRAAVLSMPLAWVMWAAAVFDSVENYALMKILLGTTQVAGYLPNLAYWCASIKFAILIVGLLYFITGIAVRFFHPTPLRKAVERKIKKK